VEAFLGDLLAVLLAVLALALLGARLRQPTVLAFLAAGVLIGPGGLGLIGDQEKVRALAEAGVVVLLFSIGLDFSFARLRRMAREALLGGGLQVGLTVLLVAGFGFFLGLPLHEAFFWGFLLAMSSTAIVLRLLVDEGLMGTAHGRLTVGILLFQDLCIVPIMLVLPVLGSAQEKVLTSSWALARSLLLALGLLLLIAAIAHFVIPRILRLFVASGKRELFVLALVALCLGSAWATAAAGLTLALGAFLAGVAVGESEFSYQALAEILPLRDSLSAFFFVSVGMLFDLRLLFSLWGELTALTLGVLFLRLGVLVVVAWLLGSSWRLGLAAGLGLAQVGEFSFLIAAAGRNFGLLGSSQEQLLLGVAVLTMGISPFLLLRGVKWLERVQALTGAKMLGEWKNPPEERAPLTGHVILAGFGGVGQMLGRIFREAQVPFCVVDYALPALHGAELEGVPSFFGDATRPEVLQAAGLPRARLLILAIGDPMASRAALRLARQSRPDLPILVATHWATEIDELYKLGATQVVAYQLEATVTLFARVLEFFHIPRHIIAAETAVARSGGYELLRAGSLGGRTLARLPELLAAGTVEVVRLPPQSIAVGKTLRELRLRPQTGASVIGVVRQQKQVPNPPADFVLAADDLVILFGSHQEVDRALSLLAPPDWQRQA
jgi:CPA2 family monovalent cation:H+ antiporter-2